MKKLTPKEAGEKINKILEDNGLAFDVKYDIRIKSKEKNGN